MRKKGQFWDLKAIILLLVIFVVLFFLTKSVAETFIKSGSSQVCLLSVIATSKTRGSPTEALGLECYTNFAGKIKGKGRDDEQKKDYIMKRIADLSYECWMQFGEGKYDVFAGKMTSKAGHCFICSKFNFDKGINSQKFVNFLKENHIGRSGKSYYDFLYNGFLWEMEGENKKSDEPIIFVESMNFKYSGEDWFDKIENYFLGTIKAIVDLDLAKLYDLFISNFDLKEMGTTINPDENGYAVVYYQASDFYWNQLWIKRLLIDYAAEKIGLYEKSVPPAKIMITKYSDVKELSCDMLQG